MSKAVIQPFEEFQKARTIFVQTVAELAKNKSNIESLKSLNVMKLLGPLLADPVNSIRQSSALAISRLAKHSEEMASEVVDEKGKILMTLINQETLNNKFYKRAACFVLSSVSSHKNLVQRVANEKVVSFLVECLEEYDPAVKESAAWTIGCMSFHDAEISKKFEKEGVVERLITCLSEPEIVIKRNVIITLSYIARHNEELASGIARHDNLQNISYYLAFKDIALKRYICLCLANIAKHSEGLSSQVITSLNFEVLKDCLKNEDKTLKKNAIQLINEIVKKNEQQTSVIGNKIKYDALIDFVNKNQGETKIFGISILATVANYSELLANDLVDSKVLPPLINAVNEVFQKEANEISFHISSAACWALGNICKHKHDLTNKVMDLTSGLPQTLLTIYLSPYSRRELQENAKYALISIIENCDKIKVLNGLLDKPATDSDSNLHEFILKKVLEKQAKVLKENNNAKKEFVDILSKIQSLKKTYKNLKDEVAQVNSIFPESIINYYSDEYEAKIIAEYLRNNN
jgi:hypothetical protein